MTLRLNFPVPQAALYFQDLFLQYSRGRLNNFIFNEQTMWSVGINLYKNTCQGPC